MSNNGPVAEGSQKKLESDGVFRGIRGVAVLQQVNGLDTKSEQNSALNQTSNITRKKFIFESNLIQLIDWLIDWLLYWFIYLLIDWLIDWLINLLFFDWLIDWLMVMLKNYCKRKYHMEI